jgi:hypothetical protein
MAVLLAPKSGETGANLAGRRLQTAAIYRLFRDAQAFRTTGGLTRFMRIGGCKTRQATLAAALLLAGAGATADPLSDRQRLAGDYFVGASVFLFERTVLSAFAPAEIRESGNADGVLDAGAIVLAREKADSESGSVALQAILAWLEAWLTLEKKTQDSDAPPGFDAKRRHDLACLAYGADPEVSVALASHIGLGSEERSGCVARYLEARKQWSQWLDPFRKADGAPAPLRAAPEGAPPEDEPVLTLVFAPTMDEADQAIADAVRENGLFQLLTDDLNATFVMPRAMTALITQCGEPRAFYNADRGEAVLCYEMLGALVQAAP